MSRQAVAPRAAYLALATLTAMNLLNYVDRYILAALVRPVQADLGLTQAQMGWVGSAFLIGYITFSPLVGWLGDRLPRRYLLTAGVGIWSLATFGTGLAASFGQILAMRGLLGLGEATYAILAPSLISDLFPRQTRNRALTIFYMAIPVGAALGFAIGGAVAARWGWRHAFTFVGLPGLAVALAALSLREPPRGASEDISDEDLRRGEHAPLTWATYATLFRSRSFVHVTAAMALYTFAIGGLQYWTSAYLQDERHMGEEQANYLLGAVVALSGILGTALGGLGADRLAARGVRGAYFLACGLPMIASAPFILLAIFIRPFWAIAASILTGLTLALMNTGPSNAILVNVTLPRIRAAAVAVNLFLIHLLGDIPSPILIGTVSDHTGHMLWGMLLTVPPLLLSGLVFYRGARFLDADQDAVLRDLRAATPTDP